MLIIIKVKNIEMILVIFCNQIDPAIFNNKILISIWKCKSLEGFLMNINQ